jgi:hypothetical protein
MDGSYPARYYVNDKKLKVQILRQKYLAVFLLSSSLRVGLLSPFSASQAVLPLLLRCNQSASI